MTQLKEKLWVISVVEQECFLSELIYLVPGFFIPSITHLFSFVVGFDIDEDAISDFQINLEGNFSPESAACINLVLADVKKLSPPTVKPFDTVILNPPFGTTDKTKG